MTRAVSPDSARDATFSRPTVERVRGGSPAARGAMRVLVGIANFGSKNRPYFDKLVARYRSMACAVDICVFTEKAKDYPVDLSVHVGLPTDNPWSLPFAHRQVFVDKVDDYDLFIYSEDDILIEARHIEAFMAASETLGAGLVPGFIRYEEHPDGRRSYPDFHGAYRWIGESVERAGDYTLARFTNDHSACYLLTQGQLRRAIASGGYAVEPHAGRYDMLCSAGTDPYTQCGMSRVICISHLADFEIHHLPNAYVRGAGMIDQDCAVLDRQGLMGQIAALEAIATGDRPCQQMFPTEKALPTRRWDKKYYEPRDDTLLSLVPAAAETVLSVGCGAGQNESRLQDDGKKVVAIPLDAVIASVAGHAGILMLPPDLDTALFQLAGRRFDAILLAGILQHVADPVEVLRRLSAFLSPGGVVVGSAPNLGPIRRWSGRLFGNQSAGYRLRGDWQASTLRLTSGRMLSGWLRHSGLHAVPTHLADGAPRIRGLIAPTLYFAARRRQDD